MSNIDTTFNNKTEKSKYELEYTSDLLKGYAADLKNSLAAIDDLQKKMQVKIERMDEIKSEIFEEINSSTVEMRLQLDTSIGKRIQQSMDSLDQPVRTVIRNLENSTAKITFLERWKTLLFAGAVSGTAIIMSLGFHRFYPQKYVIDKEIAQSIEKGEYVQDLFYKTTHKEFMKEMNYLYNRYGRDKDK